MMILLRDVAESDLPLFFESQRDPEAVAMAGVRSRDESAFFAHWRVNIVGDARVVKKTILVAGRVAGHVVSWERAGERLVGYWIDKAQWGRGIASEALAAFVAEHDPARPLFAHVSVTNAASRRVLEKSGFVPVGEPIADEDGVVDQKMRLG